VEYGNLTDYDKTVPIVLFTAQIEGETRINCSKRNAVLETALFVQGESV
jgi:hypothetical protein